MRSVYALALAVGLPLGLGSCENAACDTSTDSNPPVDFRGGSNYVSAAGDRGYESATPDGSYLNFSAGARYCVHHRLGGRPLTVEVFVSFSPTGTNGGDEAPPAGNMAEILEVNDRYIQVRNNSCANYWMRVVAAFPITDADAGMSVAPGPDGGAPGDDPNCAP